MGRLNLDFQRERQTDRQTEVYICGGGGGRAKRRECEDREEL